LEKYIHVKWPARNEENIETKRRVYVVADLREGKCKIIKTKRQRLTNVFLGVILIGKNRQM